MTHQDKYVDEFYERRSRASWLTHTNWRTWPCPAPISSLRWTQDGTETGSRCLAAQTLHNVCPTVRLFPECLPLTKSIWKPDIDTKLTRPNAWNVYVAEEGDRWWRRSRSSSHLLQVPRRSTVSTAAIAVALAATAAAAAITDNGDNGDDDNIDFISHQVQQIRQRQTDKTHKVQLHTQ